MASLENLSPKRLLFVVVGSPLVGGFLWGAANPPATWDHLVGRFIHGVLAAPMTMFVLVSRPDRLHFWPYVVITFLVLLLIAIRLPRSPVGRS